VTAVHGRCPDARVNSRLPIFIAPSLVHLFEDTSYCEVVSFLKVSRCDALAAIPM
jgi:hypothetical protein